MKMRWAWMLPVLSILALSGARSAHAQGYGPGPAGPMMAPPGYMQAMAAGYNGPGQPGLLPDAYGAYGSAEAAPPMDGPVPMGPGMMGGGMGMGMGGMGMDGGMMGGGCPHCGGAGCDACGGGQGHNGLLGDIFGLVAPYPDGGCAAVRWYDISVEYMYLRREDAGRRVDFTSLGVNGPIVLSSDSLDFDPASSFRFSAAFQVGPGSSIDFTYFGLFFWDDTATVTDANNNLFSAFSEFGQNPDVIGFPETDQSNLQRIDYESSFDSFEINFRQRHMAPNCRYQGSYLWGVRYFKLDEDFNYFTQSPINGLPVPNLNNNINVHNNMVGFQVGGDLWVCILPGLRVGGEAKAGVFGNRTAVENTITVNTGENPFVDDLAGSDVSFLGQLDLLATYRINQQWTIKAGYQFMYVDGVALAPENFNAVPPFLGFDRDTQINDNGGVFYHGASIGLEFMW